VIVLAPIVTSPFALATAELVRREPGVKLSGVVVREHLNVARLRSELRRDGVRLVRKAWRRLVLGRSPAAAGDERGFHEIVGELAIGTGSLVDWARRHGVDCLRAAEHNHPEAIAFVRERRPDVVAFTGGGLVRRPLLEVSGRGVFNTHMGVLPPYRGMDVVEWPLLERREASVGLGVTLHFMDPGVDTGPIVAVRRVPIRPGDTMERLRTRFEPVMLELLLEGIRALRDGRLEATPQARDAGRQYFVLHPRLYERARARLAAVASPGA
jgi:folate-dependent phosphoribosylglycinamide formyltransferase PurN